MELGPQYRGDLFVAIGNFSGDTTLCGGEQEVSRKG